MRTFLTFILSTIIIIGLPVVALAGLSKVNDYSTDKLKMALHHQGVYDQASLLIQQKLGQPTDPGQELSAEGQLGALVKGELTASYLQAKAEGVLDQSAAWATGKSATPPSVSLDDLHHKLMSQSPATQAQLDEVLAQLKQAQNENQGQLPQVSADPQAQQYLQQFLDQSQNVEALANGNWTFKLDKTLAGLPGFYRAYTWGLVGGMALLVLCAFGLLLTASTWATRLKHVGWVLLLAGIWNGVLAAVFNWLVIQNLQRFIPGAQEGLPSSLIMAIKMSVFDRYATIEGLLTAALVLLGAALLVARHFMRSTSSAPATPVAAPQKPISESLVDQQPQVSDGADSKSPSAAPTSATS